MLGQTDTHRGATVCNHDVDQCVCLLLGNAFDVITKRTGCHNGTHSVLCDRNRIGKKICVYIYIYNVTPALVRSSLVCFIYLFFFLSVSSKGQVFEGNKESSSPMGDP